MSAPPVTAMAPAARSGKLAAVKDRLRDGAHAVLGPVVSVLASLGLKPDHVTWAGLVISIGSGFAFFDGHSRLGAGLLALAGVCDILDGELARRGEGLSRFGAFLDSTLDRLAEAAALMGIAGFCLRNLLALVFEPNRVVEQVSIGLLPETWAVLCMTAMLAMVGSFMVSYTRARAEGLGLECKVGWFERPERLVVLILAGALKVFWAMSIALVVLAVLSLATAAQRVAHVHKNTRGAGQDRS